MNLPQEYAVAICCVFFCICKQIFFIYVSKSCLYGRKPFLYVSKTFLFVRFSSLTVFLFVIVEAVMGHHRFMTTFFSKKPQKNTEVHLFNNLNFLEIIPNSILIIISKIANMNFLYKIENVINENTE